MTSPEVQQMVGRDRWRRQLSRAAVASVVVLVLYGLTKPFKVGNPTLNLRLLAVAIGLVVLELLIQLVHWATAAKSSRLLDRLARSGERPPPAVPMGLRHATSSIEFALRSAEGRDRWFRDDARAIVQSRLAAGVEVPGHSDPAILSRRITPETWELIRPDRPDAATREPGLSVSALSRILNDLEAL